MRFPKAAALFFAFAAPSSALAAEPSPVENGVHLVWNAPAGCPERETVLAEVKRILGDAASRAAEARADVTQLAPDRWSVSLATRVEDTTGERLLEADSCAALASATALILAWTIDPLHANASMPEAPPPPAQPTEDAPKRDEAPAQITLTKTARSSTPPPAVAGLLAMSALGDRGTFPSTGGAAEITVGATVGRARAEASGSAWLNQDATRDALEGTHLHVLEGALRGCYRAIASERIEIDPCLGAALAHLSSEGFGETTPYRREAWWWSARGDLVATWRLFGRIALRGLVGVSAPLSRDPIVIVDAQRGSMPIHAPAVIAGRASLGLEVHFP